MCMYHHVFSLTGRRKPRGPSCDPLLMDTRWAHLSVFDRVNPTTNGVRPTDSLLAEPVRASRRACGAPRSPREWPRAGPGVARGTPCVGTRSGVGGVGLDAAALAQWAALLVLSVDPGRHGPFRSRLRL